MARIGMVAYSHYPQDPRIRREAEALAECGHSVDMICLQYKDQPRLETINGVRAVRLSTGRYRGASSFMYLLKYLQFFFAASFKLLSIHFKSRYQVIQVHTMPDFLVFTALIPKLMGCKVILDVHDLVPELYQTKFGISPSHWLVRLFTLVERWSIAFADRAISVSRPHLDALVKHGNPEEKFTILLNLPDTRFAQNRSDVIWRDRQAFKLIYHGTVSNRYGLDLVIRAIARLKDQIEGLEFRIIGIGEEMPRLKKLVEELGVADSVIIQDMLLTPDEFIPLIHAADAGVVPILDDDFTKCALPIKLLEYAALGKPVICTRTDAIEAYFDDSMVQYFASGSVDGLVEGICLLQASPERREALVRNADQFNREYNWERQKQAYYHLVDELVASPRR